MSAIKELSIKDPSGSGYTNRDIGAEAQNVEVSYDENGNIIEDITAAGVVIDYTQGVPKTFKDIQNNIAGKAPINHAADDDSYGAASTTKFGHIKVGTGLGANNGVLNVSYGNSAGTSCQGNDERLSNARNTPNSITFNNGGSGASSGTAFNGSSAATISYNTIGAAPTSHASSGTGYGVATASAYGHVRTGTGITNTSGTISVTYGSSAGTACQGNDGRLSDKRDPISHASSGTGYGVATTSAYGHVKTSTGITNSSGTISVAYGTSSTTACRGDDSRLGNARTPTSHASTGTGYGVGNGSYYGHVKLSDVYTSNVGAAANSVGASQNAVFNVYTIATNGSARDNTKLPLAGGTVYGDIHSAHTLRLTAGDGGTGAYAGWVNLQCNGAIQCRTYNDAAWQDISAASFDVASSKRYKENIKDISEEEAKKLFNLKVVKYDYKDGIAKEENQKNNVGFLAEDVASIINTNGIVKYKDIDGEKVPDSIDYAKFTPYLLKLIQIQQKEIEILKNKII